MMRNEREAHAMLAMPRERPRLTRTRPRGQPVLIAVILWVAFMSVLVSTFLR